MPRGHGCNVTLTRYAIILGFRYTIEEKTEITVSIFLWGTAWVECNRCQSRPVGRTRHKTDSPDLDAQTHHAKYVLILVLILQRPFHL